MSIRMNVSFNNSQIIAAITMAAKEQKISKSEFIEKVIMTYFTYHKKDEVKLSFRRKAQKSKRLNVIFNDEKIVALIIRYSKKHTLSKSKLIEFILGKYFEENNINITPNPNLDNEIKKYFELDLFSQAMSLSGKENESRYPIRGTIFYEFKTKFEIEYDFKQIVLAKLNKTFKKEVQYIVAQMPELINSNFDHAGVCYIVLPKNLKLTKIKSPVQKEPKESLNNPVDNENNLDNKSTGSLPSIQKDKSKYCFEVDSILLKIGKSTINKKNKYKKSVINPFDSNSVLKRASKHIDFASIKCVPIEDIENYQSNPDYYRLLPKKTYFYCRYLKEKSVLFGLYYIKLADKPSAISQFIKKEHIFKIDKQFLINQHLSKIKESCININEISLIENFDFPEHKNSIVNILPFSLHMLDKCLTSNSTETGKK